MLFCPVGTGTKQDRVLARLGLAAVENLPLIAAPHFDDELRLMHVFPSRSAPHFRKLMDSMAMALKLRENPHVDDDQASRISDERMAHASMS
jgi:hypothetical protein